MTRQDWLAKHAEESRLYRKRHPERCKEYERKNRKRKNINTINWFKRYKEKNGHSYFANEKTCSKCGEAFWTVGKIDLCKECRAEVFKVRRGERRERELKQKRQYAKAHHVSKRLTNPYVELVCKGCGKIFNINFYASRRMYCSKKCGRDAVPRNARHKCRIFGIPYIRGIRSKAIYDRDGWMCGICGKEIDKDLRAPDGMSASVDHIWPLSIPGCPGHVWENCQAVHLICNSRKGNRFAVARIA